MKNQEKDFENLLLHPIARIHTDFPEKFGIPRQGDVIRLLQGTIIFERDYRKEGMLRGLEGFSYLWLIFGFSDSAKEGWKATVRPPKLGGNDRVGVFASRSPYRPNPLGLSAVKMEKIVEDVNLGPTILVSGVDLVDQTPIYDIKPYLPYADCFAEASPGYGKPPEETHLEVEITKPLAALLPEERRELLVRILAQDPRPGFHHDEREYHFEFASFHISFHVEAERKVVVTEIKRKEKRK